MSLTGNTPTYSNETVQNDGFYPNISLGLFQRAYRIPAEYDTEMVTMMVALAMDEINDDLRNKRAEWEAAGAMDLATASFTSTNQKINGKDKYVMWYERAVMCLAKHKLLLEFVTADSRPNALDDPKAKQEKEQDYQVEAQKAVDKILGKPSFIAELL